MHQRLIQPKLIEQDRAVGDVGRIGERCRPHGYVVTRCHLPSTMIEPICAGVGIFLQLPQQGIVDLLPELLKAVGGREHEENKFGRCYEVRC